MALTAGTPAAGDRPQPPRRTPPAKDRNHRSPIHGDNLEALTSDGLVDGDLEAICDIQRWSAGIDCGDVVRLIAAVEQTDVLER